MIVHLIFISIFILSLCNIVYSFKRSKQLLLSNALSSSSSSSITLDIITGIIRLLPVKIQIIFLIGYSILGSIITLLLYIAYVLR